METEKPKAFKVIDAENGEVKFEEIKSSTSKEKAEQLIAKFGKLAEDVADEVLNTIKHEDNTMYYEIKFWEEVRAEILLCGLYLA